MTHLYRCIQIQDTFSFWVEKTRKESMYICPCFELRFQCATREGGLEGALSLTCLLSFSDTVTQRTFEKLEDEYICISFGNVNISRQIPLFSNFNSFDLTMFKFSNRGCIIQNLLVCYF